MRRQVATNKTIEIYTTLYNKIFDEIGYDILDVKKVISYLENKGLENITIRNYLSGIIQIFKRRSMDKKIIDEFVKKRDEYINEYNRKMHRGELTQLQKDNWIEWKDIENIKSKLKQQYEDTKDPKILQKYLLLKFYCEFPLRNDAYKIIIIANKDYEMLPEEEKRHNNYLIKNKHYILSMSDYKTSYLYGIQLFHLSNQLEKIIDEWLQYNKTNILFITNNFKQMSRNNFTRFFQSIFKPFTNKNISTRMFRHLYIVHRYAPIRKKLMEDSRKLGHSLQTQQEIYNKNTKLIY